MTTIVFPGQGSQFLGIAKDFHDNFNIAKQSFEEIEDYTKINIRKIIFNDIENKFAKQRTKKGIPLSSQTYSDLTKLSKKYSVKLKLLNE